MKTNHFQKSHKILHLFALIILIHLFIGGLNSFRLNEKTVFNTSKTVYHFIIEKYFSSNSQSGDDLPINTEHFELEENLDDCHKPLNYNFTFNNYKLIPEHQINFYTFYSVTFHPEIIPPPPKTLM